MMWYLTLAFLVLVVRAWPPRNPQDDSPVVVNANHIFNAIHSSMRQWGSSLNHNGMSLFLASVPAGTLLYHGSPQEKPVTGLEWLSFETEHAINFAHINLVPGIPPFTRGPMPGNPSFIESQQSQRGMKNTNGNTSRPPAPDLPIWDVPGHFHTYAAKHDLKLLYIDGSAAAKMDLGTLDTTDILIRKQDSSGNFTDLFGSDSDRAAHLCQIAEQEWNGQIEGFIRMEAGFEIIMCSFQKSLHFLRAARPYDVTAALGDNAVSSRVFHWLTAASRRYDGIGGSPPRVTLNYENFVSAFSFPLKLFENNAAMFPRLNANDTAILRQMRHYLTEMVTEVVTTSDHSNRHINWQAIADFVVTEFSDPLQDLITSPACSESGIRLAQQLTFMMYAYIDMTHRDTKQEIQRCIERFVPTRGDGLPPEHVRSPVSQVARRAIREVTAQICTTLHTTLQSLPSANAESTDDIIPTAQIEDLRRLVAYLDWPIWKRCRGGGYNEICSIPMFPWGSMDDYNQPRCRGVDTLAYQRGYWHL